MEKKDLYILNNKLSVISELQEKLHIGSDEEQEKIKSKITRKTNFILSRILAFEKANPLDLSYNALKKECRKIIDNPYYLLKDYKRLIKS